MTKYLYMEKEKISGLHYADGKCYAVIDNDVYKEIAMPRGNIFMRLEMKEVPDEIKKFLRKDMIK